MADKARLSHFANLSDEEIANSTDVFCYNHEKFEKEIYSCKNYQSIMLFSIYLEHILNVVLGEEFPNSSALKLRNIGAGLKVDMLNALGLIDEGVFIFIKHVSSVRNKIVHNLEFELDKRSISGIISKCPKEILGVIEFSGDEDPLYLQKILRSVIAFLEFQRQARAKRRLTEQRGWAQVHLKLEKLGLGPLKEHQA